MAHRTSSRRSGGDAEPDIQIGEFVRGKEIGKGSFATVYIASHKSKRSYAAVKAVIQNKLTRKLKDNLESEIRILKSLQHPHIVALFSCTETPSHIYLVMEYCQLSDLAQFMKKREQLTMLPETADIFKKYPNSQYGLNEVLVRHFVKQIASALEYLRVRNLIHRDIKPQNLLLNPSPAFMARQKPEDVPLAASEHSLVPAVGVDTLPMLKIADFGFARHLPQTMMAETLCGSPLYMAPEILSYHKYDAKADLWSVGTVTYEMMCGKPPFRAANHIELLKKIDDAKDRIPFPSGIAISSDLHRMIRHLLKRQPTERVSFEGFFKSPPVVDAIPGLVGEDVPRTPSVPVPDPGLSELSRRMQRQAIDDPAQSTSQQQPTAALSLAPSARVASPGPVSPRTNVPLDVTAGRRPSLSSRGNTIGGSRPMDIQRPNRQEERPSLVAHATAPARDLLLGQQYSARDPTGIRRRSSRTAPAPSTSAPREAVAVPVRRNTEQMRPVADQDPDKTAQDLAFEKEYVLVEKRAVEVNAFADELAASPHLYNRSQSGQNAGLARRSTSQGIPTSTSGAQPPSPSQAMQLAHGRRSDSGHHRQASFERRFAPNPSSATNMLSKALNMANARLFGALGASPPVAGLSPPRGYTAFPSYPTPSVGLAITTGKEEPRGAQDEDSRILRIVEEAATRSDTVYSFAEVKYRQLLPATPSADEGPSIRQIGALEKPSALNTSNPGTASEEDQELTQMAVVAVSEEALVLFVKALSILAKSIDLASYWWSHHRQRPSPSPPSRLSPAEDSPPLGNRTTNSDVSRRMNNVVQWMRNRFNECLEKSEIVGRRLVEAQKQLPLDHPGHPGNHANFQSSSGSASAAKPNKLGSSGSSAGSLGAAADNIQLTSGVTAEKLMFERAVEMSRAAAVNELVGEDLRGCEISYRTAMILLEAVLEGDEEPLSSRGEREGKEEGKESEAVEGLDGEERRAVVQLLEGTRHRLRSLVRKIQIQAQAEREMRRLSSQGVPGTGAGGISTMAKLKSGSPVLAVGTPPR
ncbi:Serine/threonine-protein kinase ATG1 [Sphaceloma murrayae]|uniref:non-specific serine/threonine protein kinase n=1 Tax=Sphaceloma murrayae TaxID=2082308 RepID=A0A2K1QZS6_9PEZI|nr:Serine/threonine-protein kinase ATG1 [Sphaceloma murrayae]